MKFLFCFIFFFSSSLHFAYGHPDFTYGHPLKNSIFFKNSTSQKKALKELNPKNDRSSTFFTKNSFKKISYSTQNPNFYLAKNEDKNPKTNWPRPPMIKYEKTSKTRKNLSIIALSGLSGAILGLSTISFSNDPGKASSHITIGFAVGVLLGSLITLYNLITSHSLYQQKEKKVITQFKRNTPFYFNLNHPSYKSESKIYGF